MTGMVTDMRANRAALKAATAAGFLTATDLADWLVRVLGMPFRRAHHVTGSIVKLAEERGCGLADLPLDAMQAIEPGITEDIFSVLSVENAVDSRVSEGRKSVVSGKRVPGRVDLGGWRNLTKKKTK